MLNLTNIRFAYNNQLVFDDLNLSINQGDFIFLIGKSGAGKSTLLELMYMNLFPQEGYLEVGDFSTQTIRKNEIAIYRRKLGVVFQDFKLMEDRTVYDNLSFVLQIINTPKKLIKKKVINALTEVGLIHKQKNFPDELSGGEKQRIAIARAIINDPMILIADEPTGNLDPETAYEILDIFKKINKNGTTVIIATHNYDLVKKTDAQILKLDNGKVIKVILKTKNSNSNSDS
ncbi:MAG: ATP-binding cassette domain-containing protein [Ignavibacteriales bacterium]